MFSCDEMTVGFPNRNELVEKDEFVKMIVVKLSVVLENDSLLGRSSEIKFSVELDPAGFPTLLFLLSSKIKTYEKHEHYFKLLFQ